MFVLLFLWLLVKISQFILMDLFLLIEFDFPGSVLIYKILLQLEDLIFQLSLFFITLSHHLTDVGFGLLLFFFVILVILIHGRLIVQILRGTEVFLVLVLR